MKVAAGRLSFPKAPAVSAGLKMPIRQVSAKSFGGRLAASVSLALIFCLKFDTHGGQLIICGNEVAALAAASARFVPTNPDWDGHQISEMVDWEKELRRRLRPRRILRHVERPG